LQGAGGSDVSERVRNTAYVLFVDEKKGRTVGFDNVGTESLSGERGVVYESVGKV